MLQDPRQTREKVVLQVPLEQLGLQVHQVQEDHQDQWEMVATLACQAPMELLAEREKQV